MMKMMVFFSAFVCLIMAGSALATNELTILPHMIGPSNPETMVFGRDGLLLPGGADSWVFSNVVMPLPEGFAGSQVRLVTIYFMPTTDEVGDVAFGIGMKSRAVGTLLHYGGSTDTGSPVWLYNNAGDIMTQQILMDYPIDDLDLLSFGIQRRVYDYDSYPDGVNILAVTVEDYNDMSAVEPGPELPDPVELAMQAVPNPFNPSTTINFSLARAGKVNVSVFDPRGYLVEELVVGQEMEAGKHQVQFAPRDTASGVYFVQVTLDGLAVTRKVSMIK